MSRASRCLAALLLGALPVAAAHAQGFVPDPITAEIWTLDKCLDVPSGDPADQVPLQVYRCHGRANQRWLVRFDFAGFAILESEQTHKCLDVPSSTTVQQFRCHGGDNQRWQIVEDPDTLRLRFIPKLRPNRCLHVKGDNSMDLVQCFTTTGAVLVDRARWERQNFEVRVLSAFAGNRILINEDRRHCLDVAGLSQDDTAPIQAFPCNSGPNQLWGLARQGDGFFTIRAQHSGKCLKWQTGIGTRGVSQAACVATQDQQKWHLQLTSSGRVRLQTKRGQCHLLPTPGSPNTRGFCECLDAPASGQVLRVTSCNSSGDVWRLGEGRRAPGAITFFEDNGLGGDTLCGLSPAAGDYRFEQPGARACENDEARSLLLYEVAGGTVIHVFDDGRCRTTDDHTTITVKQRLASGNVTVGVARYEIPSFERDFDDAFVNVDYKTSGNLDGKVSCVRITTPP
ncbi:MAG TPA: RICIN domain-containing protein [Thermoanaerobaculia bacterium]|nr:RICIN domain-containing protein [Thermoanaerobaculia bacterium]